ncbi:MAG: YncE family protein, partial [Actinomycetota bacterium]|nr:YncE family protein [Actinomycetota bacterium]
PLVYVPNSASNTLDVIDPSSYKVIAHYRVGQLPQHVTPSWDLKTLYVDNDVGNTLTPVNPRTGRPGRPIPVIDPYNLYFTPDGRSAIVVAERLQRLDFRNPATMKLVHSLSVPQCAGVDHMDFSADGRYLYASCEFASRMIEVDLRTRSVIRTLYLDHGRASPQDVKLSPDGRTLYSADQTSGGVWEINPETFRVTGFLNTGAGAHGLYPSRDDRFLYVSNRQAGTVSVVSFKTKRVVRRWQLPLPASPDMGGVSADGKTLWLSGRYDSVVYAIDTRTGHLRAAIAVGQGPHGLCVWPQPGSYSLGHTGILR